MSVEDQRLLTVAEVADQLQMTPDGVYKLIQRGKLEAVRISERKTRIPESAFNRYYAELEARADGIGPSRLARRVEAGRA